jgi:hypothetical protein
MKCLLENKKRSKNAFTEKRKPRRPINKNSSPFHTFSTFWSPISPQEFALNFCLTLAAIEAGWVIVSLCWRRDPKFALAKRVSTRRALLAPHDGLYFQVDGCIQSGINAVDRSRSLRTNYEFWWGFGLGDSAL